MVYHEDERPAVTRMKLAAIEAVKSQPERFGALYFDSISTGKNARENVINAPIADRERAELQSRVKQLEHELSSAKARRDRLQDLYKKQTARAEKFKVAYQTIKGSPQYKVANVIGKPLRAASRIARKSLTRDEHQQSRPTNPAQSQTAIEAPADSGKPKAVQISPVPETTTSSYIKELRHDFYRRGQVSSVAEALRGLAEHEFRESTQLDGFRKHVDGWLRVIDNPPEVGPAQTNAGYFAERDRVLYCAHSTGRFNSNGYSTRTSALTAALTEHGEDLTVIARPGYPWDAKVQGKKPKARRTEMRIDGVNHVFNPGHSLTDQPLDEYIATATDTFVREAIRFRAGLIHSASNYLTALPALIAARRLGIPFVYEVRGLWEVTESLHKPEWVSGERYALAVKLETLAATKADRVLAITEQVASELQRRGVDAQKVSVVPNAADSATFLPGPPDKGLQAKLDLEPGTPVVGYAGSLVEYEGLELLISAFEQLHQHEPTARLLIVGDGAALAGLRTHAADVGVSAACIFTGRVPAKDIPRYLSLFTVAPIPRLKNTVTELVSPIKPLEALAAGIPLVVSDVPPLRDIIGADDERGVSFTPGSVEELAAALQRVLSDRRLRGNLTRRGRQWVARERSWGRVAQLVASEHEAARTSTVEEAVGLGTIRMGLIADEFTTRSLEPECTIVPLSPAGWETEIENIDVLMVESAWEGNAGLWHRKIGYYGEDEARDLDALLAACHRRKIPTLFWNKEDPVHINRFIPTAVKFDHIFTTDANCVARYWAAKSRRTKTVATVPFFAQPKLHHPLPHTREYQHTVAYGGSYYGDRYAERSLQLKTLLDGVGASSVTIYDRQANNPESPYAFPPSLAHRVAGGLSYTEMCEAYRAHPVHLNVNSVNDSPTMFSRRVMELAASGTPMLTWIGPGISSTIGDVVPSAKNVHEASLLTEMWLGNERIRIDDGWRLHRAAYRAHLAGHRLAYMFRTAGLAIKAPELPGFDIQVPHLDSPVCADILRQTLLPRRVKVVGKIDGPAAMSLEDHGIVVEPASIRSNDDMGQNNGLAEHLTVHLEAGADRTMTEDLVRASRLLPGQAIQRQDGDVDVPGSTLLAKRPRQGLGSILTDSESGDDSPVWGLRRANAVLPVCSQGTPTTDKSPAPVQTKTVLIAGHDLKFAGEIVRKLENDGHTVLIDQWQNHTEHDSDASMRLLSQADVIFCEWSLGNVKWFADRKRDGQRLVSRFHLQELYTPYLNSTRHDLVDAYIFVGELIRRAAVSKFGMKNHQTTVVPNYVDLDRFSAERDGETAYSLGFVGFTPERKRLDLALDVLSELRSLDPRYQLFIKGQRPEQYEWMRRRPAELAYYEEQYQRIDEEPLLRGAVHFDAHGDDMPEWYAKVGAVLSVSDFESFHLTLPDGAAAGALPLSLAWAGSELIYPESWLFETTAEMARSYHAATTDRVMLRQLRIDAREYVADHFDAAKVVPQLVERILGS